MNTIYTNSGPSVLRCSVLALFATFVTLLAAPVATAQFLNLERTINGVPQNIQTLLDFGPGSGSRLDFNGDDIPDRVSVYSDPAAGDFMRVTDGADSARTWLMQLDGDPDSPIILGRHSLIGFFNFDGIVTNENPKEIVFGTIDRRQNNYLGYQLKDLIISGYNVTTPTVKPQPLGIIAILIGILDIDRDGEDEVMLVNPGAGVTQIWGAN